ncbi:hypothetical protein OIU78_010230 [Salix suchowensis]|nr:hypothetical protein OIU78_010230 [Salix suchowensis]
MFRGWAPVTRAVSRPVPLASPRPNSIDHRVQKLAVRSSHFRTQDDCCWHTLTGEWLVLLEAPPPDWFSRWGFQTVMCDLCCVMSADMAEAVDAMDLYFCDGYAKSAGAARYFQTVELARLGVRFVPSNAKDQPHTLCTNANAIPSVFTASHKD